MMYEVFEKRRKNLLGYNKWGNKSFKTIVTRGANNTILITDTVKEFETEKVIPKDTTGAGDAYNAGFLYNSSLYSTLFCM